MTDLVTELKKIQPTTKRTQQIAFVFAFLALLVDGADMLLLSFSLNSLKAEFGLSNLQAGALGSATLAGMAVGGFLGGWACDRLGRVRTVVISSNKKMSLERLIFLIPEVLSSMFNQTSEAVFFWAI